MRAARSIVSIIIFFLLCFSAEAATVFPYTNISLNLPGTDDPYPGLGSNYSSLGIGIRSVLWNPASLGKINASEAYFGITSVAPSSVFNKNYNQTDQNFNLTGGGSNNSNFTNLMMYTNDPLATTIATREFAARSIYSPLSSGMDYKQAIKVDDRYSFGITSRGDTNLSLDVSGTFPMQYYSAINLLGSSNFLGSGISIGNDGKLTYKYSPVGFSAYTYTSEASVYSGFISQAMRIPFSVITEAHDSMNIQSNLTFTGATKWNKLYAGLNFTPISASISVDNTAKAIVNAGTADPYFYSPNFNPNDENDVLQWMADPSRYGTTAGYNKKYVRVPAGESVGEAKYTGFYQASAVRMDLGFMYDLGEAATIGLSLDNIGGSALNFKGVGRVAYVNSRINTSESVSLIDPSTTKNWSPFSDNFNPMSGTENLGMVPEFNVTIPQKTKIGITLRKPILITFDYETQTSPVMFRSTNSDGTPTNVILSNIKILRGGLETGLFFLPIQLKGNMAFMMKPDATGLDAQGADSFNKAFIILHRLMPLSGDLGTTFDVWGNKIDWSGGFDLSSLINLTQLDTLSSTFGKYLYYNLSLNKDNWHITMQNNLDLIASAAAYSNAPQAQKDSGNISTIMGYLRWISTLTLGFNF